ncbi:sulfatase [Paenibacillus thalictri]|uniref:Sulfatase n=1 Tax=Paenibacillus thalictri TaxID=2527873 RepID=A0A4Q9DRS0_9BACL|nr:sulfatase [Paenibacillus thalictri]TBL79507.1 sulfatase [Paenibacillus thalictri]
MRAVVVLFDSLNRHMLPPYGGSGVHAPNFERLARHCVTFDNAWVGSMPCMPARRDLHTGRYNFLHRSWGPLEPFDDSFVTMLKNSGVYTHLVSDHYHYWEAGGATYHTQYNSWEFCRGQEGDPWKGEVGDPDIPEHVGSFEGHRGALFRQDWINRTYMQGEAGHPQTQTFAQGLEFIHTNAVEDNWLLQIEAFDPHEPFFSPQTYKDLYPHEYAGKHFDWPAYKRVTETPEEAEHCRYEYKALLSMCDASLGRLLDTFDKLDLWKDTMLIVSADHGFLLGEHDWWAKNTMPLYNEIARIPFFIWDPRTGRSGVRNNSLVQWIDVAPTLLQAYGLAAAPDMRGVSLAETLEDGRAARSAVLFGYHGAHVNCTDGRHVYMKAPERADNKPLYNYTLMPANMGSMFGVKELQHIELQEPFGFTKGVRTLKIPAATYIGAHGMGTLLYDIEADPGQNAPIADEATERLMRRRLTELMREHEAPVEQYERLGLTAQASQAAVFAETNASAQTAAATHTEAAGGASAAPDGTGSSADVTTADAVSKLGGTAEPAPDITKGSDGF